MPRCCKNVTASQSNLRYLLRNYIKSLFLLSIYNNTTLSVNYFSAESPCFIGFDEKMNIYVKKMFDYPVDIGILIISSNERTRLTDEILNESI